MTEIAAVTVPHYDEMFIQLFSQTMTQMEAMLPVDTNIREAYSNGHDAEQQFIQDLALFFCAYLKGKQKIMYEIYVSSIWKIQTLQI